MEHAVAVIGAGFSGAIVAAQLLQRGLGGRRLRLMLINRSGQMARGLAYGTRSEQHLLNVPAGRMSAFADDDGDFLRYVQATDPAVGGGAFVSRQLYGDYLEHVLQRAVARAAPGATLERLIGEVVDLVPQPGGTVTVVLDSGERQSAERVVLAIGNYAPADPALADRRFIGARRYVRDPWVAGALEVVRPDAPALLIGTGLTMIDVALELRSRQRRAPLVALSRRGLVPQPHRGGAVPPTFEHRPPEIERGPATAAAYLHSVRAHVRRMALQGIDWRDVIAALRPITPALWQRLPIEEQRRFLRHLRGFWEVHRHRAAPRPAALLERMRADGELAIEAGRLLAIEERGDLLDVTWRRRGAGDDGTRRLSVGAVVNCTGPCTDVGALADPLVQALRGRGLLRGDALGLGADIGSGGGLMDAAGRESGWLFHVGPLLRARDWEATAVPELRVHAARLAERLAAELSGVTSSGDGGR